MKQTNISKKFNNNLVPNLLNLYPDEPAFYIDTLNLKYQYKTSLFRLIPNYGYYNDYYPIDSIKTESFFNSFSIKNYINTHTLYRAWIF